MCPARNFLWVFPLLLPFLFLNTANVFADVSDDYTPDVTARVARISFAHGDVEIKRAGDRSDWEHATQNLPIVEGDEITTGANARLEIQFDSRNYLRLAENSYLKITTLKDEGIAVSLSQGSLNLRVLEFDKQRSYFEVDAPKTTVAVQKAGMYRIDAGDNRKPEVRVTVTGEGEARLYSENSGFVLRSGRSSRIYLEGNYAGEWETSDAVRYADDFDNWALERDATIAKRLQTAAYDKYYDRDVYGAEDLSDYGEWIYTKKYGYVWRPFSSAVSSYANWSPYRYGHWRWVPPYGWTWVNDEPWGWATYHHGRWVYDSTGWVWTPYPQHRARRNWWQPALVVVTYSGSLICWYPLPYEYNYYNYNSTYIDRRRTTIINNTTVIVNPTPAPTPVIGAKNRRFERKPPELDVPPTGVVAVDASDFGRKTRGFMTAPPELAKKVLSRMPQERENTPPLPTYTDLNGNLSREIRVDNPPVEKINRHIQIGADQRREGISLDENLHKERIYGNRPPIERTPPSEAREDGGNIETRKTGAVKRLPRSEIVRDVDNLETKEKPSDSFPVRSTGGKSQENNGADSNSEQPVYKARNKNREREQTPPTYDSAPQPQEQEEERMQRKEHRQAPPVQQSPPQEEQKQHREERRQTPPEREQPQPRVEPRPEPPRRTEPKPEPREEKPPPSERKTESTPPHKEREKPVDKDG